MALDAQPDWNAELHRMQAEVTGDILGAETPATSAGVETQLSRSREQADSRRRDDGSVTQRSGTDGRSIRQAEPTLKGTSANLGGVSAHSNAYSAGWDACMAWEARVPPEELGAEAREQWLAGYDTAMDAPLGSGQLIVPVLVPSR